MKGSGIIKIIILLSVILLYISINVESEFISAKDGYLLVKPAAYEWKNDSVLCHVEIDRGECKSGYGSYISYYYYSNSSNSFSEVYVINGVAWVRSLGSKPWWISKREINVSLWNVDSNEAYDIAMGYEPYEENIGDSYNDIRLYTNKTGHLNWEIGGEYDPYYDTPEVFYSYILIDAETGEIVDAEIHEKDPYILNQITKGCIFPIIFISIYICVGPYYCFIHFFILTFYSAFKRRKGRN